MTDTSEKINEIFEKMFADKTPEEKAKMGFSMFESAKKIVLSTIKDKKRWQPEFFTRFYGNDFDENTLKKIVKALKKASCQED